MWFPTAITRRPDIPDPILEPGNIEIPSDIHKVFTVLRKLLYNDPLVPKLIRFMSHYPVTKILIETEDSYLKKQWEQLIDLMDMPNFLKQIGYHYFAYGNAFVVIQPPFKRQLRCQRCGAIITTDQSGKVVSVNQKKDKLEVVELKDLSLGTDPRTHELVFTGTCPVCNSRTTFEVTETNKKPPKEVDQEDITELPSLVIIQPEYIKIEYNPISNSAKYYHRIPPALAAKLRKDPFYMLTTPLPILKAVQSASPNKEVLVAIKPHLLYHFKHTVASGIWEGWGLPPLYPALKLLYLIQMMMRATMELAWEHSQPMRIIFPQHGAGGQPYPSGFSMFARMVNSYLQRHRKNRWSILVSPYPMQMLEVGGRAKVYMMIPEIQALFRTLLWSTDIPAELVMGGTWAGQFVAMRLLENSFEPYIKQLESFLNWWAKYIGKFYNLAVPVLKLKPPRRADDVSVLQLLLQMVGANMVSKDTVLDMLDLDFDTELSKIMDERIKEVKAQSRASVEINKEQMKQQAELLEAMVSQAVPAEQKIQFMAEVDKWVSGVAEALKSGDQETAQQIMLQLQQRAEQGDPVAQVAMMKIQAALSETQAEEEENKKAQKETEEQVESPPSSPPQGNAGESNVPKPPKRRG